jgi:beta-glucanase (GH16 family)
LDCFDFFTASDPTHGFVDYVGKDEANSLGLLNVTAGGAFRMAADSKNVAASSGRKSIRLSSKKAFTTGLFIIDLEHMPAGCGTWPAFWLVGPSWPHHGEIDIIEGVNLQTSVQSTLHTGTGCTMAGEDPAEFTGTWGKVRGLQV